MQSTLVSTGSSARVRMLLVACCCVAVARRQRRQSPQPAAARASRRASRRSAAAQPRRRREPPLLNRANEVLPAWLRVRGEFRERMEGFDGLGFIDDARRPLLR